MSRRTGDVKLAVSLVAWAPFEARLHTDGREISPFAREGQLDPLMLKSVAGLVYGNRPGPARRFST